MEVFSIPFSEGYYQQGIPDFAIALATDRQGDGIPIQPVRSANGRKAKNQAVTLARSPSHAPLAICKLGKFEQTKLIEIKGWETNLLKKPPRDYANFLCIPSITEGIPLCDPVLPSPLLKSDLPRLSRVLLFSHLQVSNFNKIRLPGGTPLLPFNVYR
jgi:hypothetical protein